MQNVGRWTRWWNIINLLSVQQYLRFYEIMKYPVPTRAELYFQYSETKQKNKSNFQNINNYTQNQEFSRDKKSEYIDEYLNEINKLKKIFQSIPFVEEIYLCNSITFNALNKNSDIDIFIITQPWRIRSTKFRSTLLFLSKNSKRIGKNIRKKICLSFFITSDQQNLYPISLPTMDIYLAYWISHLVQIYKTEKEYKSTFFSQNKWVKWILPNFQGKQTISLWIEPFEWNTKFKNFLEFIWNWFIWNIFERIIKIIQMLNIKLKIAINPMKNKDVIINDSMLKFHKDIREKISLKYSIKIKK